MTPPARGQSSAKTQPRPSREVSLLEALAAAGEALTEAIVRHDLDAIVAATREAEAVMADLGAGRRAARDGAATASGGGTLDEPGGRPDPAVLLLGARIGATARRNALLLERAWATDAALLRLIAGAAQAEARSAAGAAYAPGAAHVPAAHEPVPAGWLDRSA